MHIGYALTNQFKGLGIIEEVQGLLVGQTSLLCKQFDDTCIFALKEYWIGLHTLQCDVFNKLKIAVNHLLRGDTDLVIGLFPTQLFKSLITGINALNVKIYSIKDIVVSDATLNAIILLMRQSLATSCHVVKPFAIVGRKHFAIDISNLLCKFIDIHDSRLTAANETLTIFASLLLKRCKIHAIAKVQMAARMIHVWLRNNEIGCMEDSHDAFKTPFLFIRSTRSSTIYSRENVCNTS